MMMMVIFCLSEGGSSSKEVFVKQQYRLLEIEKLLMSNDALQAKAALRSIICNDGKEEVERRLKDTGFRGDQLDGHLLEYASCKVEWEKITDETDYTSKNAINLQVITDIDY